MIIWLVCTSVHDATLNLDQTSEVRKMFSDLRRFELQCLKFDILVKSFSLDIFHHNRCQHYTLHMVYALVYLNEVYKSLL